MRSFARLPPLAATVAPAAAASSQGILATLVGIVTTGGNALSPSLRGVRTVVSGHPVATTCSECEEDKGNCAESIPASRPPADDAAVRFRFPLVADGIPHSGGAAWMVKSLSL